MVKIFIIEDEVSIQKLYKAVLELNGFEIIGVANNGIEAINMYKSFPKSPDIILMDHRMPFKNGLETSREILQINNTAKIIFTSADESVYDEALELGAKSFKVKPFNFEKLISNINKTLNLS